MYERYCVIRSAIGHTILLTLLLTLLEHFEINIKVSNTTKYYHVNPNVLQIYPILTSRFLLQQEMIFTLFL